MNNRVVGRQTYMTCWLITRRYSFPYISVDKPNTSLLGVQYKNPGCTYPSHLFSLVAVAIRQILLDNIVLLILRVSKILLLHAC